MAEDWKKPLTFWKPKDNISYIAKDIMTKLYVHYSIVTYPWNLINCLLKPRLHWFHRQSADCQWCESADSRLILCFLGSAGDKKKYNWPVWFFSIGRLSLGLGKRFGVDRPYVDYRPHHRPRFGWHSANFYLKWVTQTCLTFSRLSADSRPSDGR